MARKPTRTGLKRLTKERDTLYAAALIMDELGEKDVASALFRRSVILSCELRPMHREVYAIEQAKREELGIA